MPEEIEDPGVDVLVGPAPVRPRTWALVRDGVVEQVKHTLDWFRHPFGEIDGARVVDGTGVEVHPGFLVDDKGNFTPAEGRTASIPQGLPAYHAGPGIVRRPGELAAELSNSELPEKLREPAQPLPVSNEAGMATVEPRNKDVAEHDAPLEPVHTTGVIEPNIEERHEQPNEENTAPREDEHHD